VVNDQRGMVFYRKKAPYGLLNGLSGLEKIPFEIKPLKGA